MLIISFDAVGDGEYSRMAQYPAFASFAAQAAVFRDVPSLFVSNTYPVHTSIATGVAPDVHGVTANTAPYPAKHPAWNCREDMIRVKTLWQLATEKGIETASVFWPMTAFSKTMRYNIPEVLARPGKSQIMSCLRAGNAGLQIKMLLCHARLLKGISQPSRDNFATACMCDILRKHKPGLALMHLTAYDSLCHKLGTDGDGMDKAYESLDANLSALLDAAGADRPVIVFSDHAQVNVHTVLAPNETLVAEKLLAVDNGTYYPGEYGCYAECCGGSAFFHASRLPSDRVGELRTLFEGSEGFRRFLSEDEMQAAGYAPSRYISDDGDDGDGGDGGAGGDGGSENGSGGGGNDKPRRKREGCHDVAFGFCAKAGYCYEPFKGKKNADHGYPLDMPEYSVFYMVRGLGMPPGKTQGGSLLDITALAQKWLDTAGQM
jgi:predicted AlkP superfamily pyrophosphatase or phosphodiesterase